MSGSRMDEKKLNRYLGPSLRLLNYSEKQQTVFDSNIQIMLPIIKSATVYIMGLFYIAAGVKHFQDPVWFIRIVPPILPFKMALVYISGFFEVFFGILLMIEKTRSIAGWGLILLLIAVYPANIYLALTNGAAMDTTPIIAWGRLPFQFVFIGLAYWHTKLQELVRDFCLGEDLLLY